MLNICGRKEEKKKGEKGIEVEEREEFETKDSDALGT